MLSSEEQSNLDAQIALSKSLSLGLVFSLFPILGLGSIAAILIGVRGHRKIAASGQKLVGAKMAILCVVVGVIGLIINIFFFWTKVFRPR
jgi:hypothetical protein